ncbi:M15 family metallopeptidase [Cellulosimicrobium sp. NPDC057127]|uniref:M15 family metallopeptidase n=1 Tax=Cellulosimicrobium sp. NPDC057127 TaxID=3346026 RepID=UPI00363C6793
MTESTSRSRTSLSSLVLVLFVVAVVLALAGATTTVLGVGAPWSSGRGSTVGEGATEQRTAAEPGASGTARPGEGEADGLDPELLRRFEEARAAAAAEGVELRVTSGWRSAAEQQELVERALERYGSVEETHRWVLPPESSEHVAGAAIDVGPTEGAYWLQQHGARFGLCQTYANEVWHYEAAAEPGGTCPPQHADASHGW